METAQQVRIGLLNDLHYDGGVEALNRLYESVAALNQGRPEALLLLGDLIGSESGTQAQRLLREVSALCDSFKGPIRYLPGNHDLDHISKAEFYNALGCAGDQPTGRMTVGGTELIFIDGNFSPDGTEYNAGNFEWNQSYVPDEQLAWLREQLDAVDAPVIICTHQRVDGEGDFMVRNHDAVRKVIQQSGKVKAVFQGHQHADDLRQLGGVPYYTLAAHIDGAGPAMVNINTKGILLERDYRPAAAPAA